MFIVTKMPNEFVIFSGDGNTGYECKALHTNRIFLGIIESIDNRRITMRDPIGFVLFFVQLAVVIVSIVTS